MQAKNVVVPFLDPTPPTQKIAPAPDTCASPYTHALPYTRALPDTHALPCTRALPYTHAARGIDTSAILPEISELLDRGGINSMMETIRMILCAFSFAGIITKAGCLDVILQKLLEYVKGRAGLIISTMASTILMAITTGSDFLTILIPGELFADAYKQKGLAARNLSRTLEDCGTCVVALIPWSAAGAYCAGVLGVSTVEYLPYSFFGFFSVLMALVCAITGYGILTLEDEKKQNEAREKKHEKK